MVLDPNEDLNCKLCLRELKGYYYRLCAPDGMPSNATHQLIVCVSCYKLAMTLARLLDYGILTTQWNETKEKIEKKPDNQRANACEAIPQ